MRVRLLVALIACLIGSGAGRISRAEHFDLIIRNGKIIDGTTNPSYHSDLAVKQGRIAKIANTAADTSDRVIDARGMIVAPGFIDVHTHVEGSLLDNPEAENFVRMGVTTVVTGNCGGSSVEIADFLTKLQQKVSINVGTLIGHGSVRNAVMKTENRPPRPDELDAMRKLVEKAMQEGAVGLSTGLIYVPGTYAKTDEIVELAKVVSHYNGIYATHMRDEGNDVLAAIREAIRIGEEAKLPVEISHFKVSSKKKWGESKNTLRLVEEARARGLDITVDQYVYTASSTSLGVLLPSWALEGGSETLRERLSHTPQRQKIKQEMIRDLKKSGWKDYSYAYVANYPPDPSLNGKNIAEITKLKRKKSGPNDQIEQIFEMQLAATGRIGMVYHKMNEKDVERILKHPLTMIASDSGVLKFGNGVPHPRGYGNNPKVLGEYVRVKRILSLEDAIRKMTSLPAQTFKLKDRGLIKEGMKADLVVFDESKIRDKAIFKEPHRYAEGIPYVLVNGVAVVWEGQHSKAYPGEVLYGPGKK